MTTKRTPQGQRPYQVLITQSAYGTVMEKIYLD